MKNKLLLFAILFCSINLFAQNNYSPAKLYTTKGEFSVLTNLEDYNPLKEFVYISEDNPDQIVKISPEELDSVLIGERKFYSVELLGTDTIQKFIFEEIYRNKSISIYVTSTDKNLTYYFDFGYGLTFYDGSDSQARLLERKISNTRISKEIIKQKFANPKKYNIRKK